MSKLVAVQGCTIEYETDPASVSLSLSAVISTASSKVSSGNKAAYKDKITITVGGGTIVASSTPGGASSPTGTVPTGSITIDGTSEKTDTEGDKFVLEGDEGEADFICIFPPSSGSTPVTETYTITAKVTGAGQNVLKVT